MKVEVECYAGHRGEQTPQRLRFGDRIVEVIDIIDCWLAPDHRYFKVQGSDEASYIVRQNLPDGEWELTMMDRRTSPPTISLRSYPGPQK